jgi:hypothetical protein
MMRTLELSFAIPCRRIESVIFVPVDKPSRISEWRLCVLVTGPGIVGSAEMVPMTVEYRAVMRCWRDTIYCLAKAFCQTMGDIAHEGSIDKSEIYRCTSFIPFLSLHRTRLNKLLSNIRGIGNVFE